MQRMDVGRIEILLLIACVVAIVARRLKLPYTVGLVLAGIALAFFDAWPNQVPISKEVIFDTLLPPLVFEGAYAIRWRRLKKDLLVVGVLATAGVVLASAIVAWGMVAVVGWDWRAAFLFGALIAATDPVSVIAMMKDAKVGGRLKLLIESESLMNDGTGAALFVIGLAVLDSGHFSLVISILQFLYISIGGLAVGGGIAFLCTLLMGTVSDHLVEIALSTVAAWGSFLLADQLGLSGVLATVAAGLVIGNYGPLRWMSSKGRDDAETFWEFAAFVANSFIFLMMGVKVGNESYRGLWWEVAFAIVLVILSRFVTVFGLLIPFSKTKLRVPYLDQTVMSWGGLRGAVALALALSIRSDLPNYHQVIAVTFAVVAFTVLINGTTVKPLLKKAGRRQKNLAPAEPSAA